MISKRAQRYASYLAAGFSGALLGGLAVAAAARDWNAANALTSMLRALTVPSRRRFAQRTAASALTAAEGQHPGREGNDDV
jgi:hypothetical protein